MGCSPSKGKLFGGAPEAPGAQEALLDETTQDNVDFKSVEVADCSIIDEGENKLLPAGDQNVAMVELTIAPPDTVSFPEGGAKDIEVNMIPPEVERNSEPMDKVKNVEKRRKNKGLEKSKKKEKLTHASLIQGKVDLPPQMVRAHQAAYAYLNPNISKYEALLGLLDQAAQTNVSLQPTMKALVLRFEEVNQAMEEMAEEGELMLKEHGDYMGWPSGMNGLTIMPAMGIVNTSKPPPDLLQHMLQHSIESLRHLGESAQGLGDTTLEEGVGYFSSVSKLLTDKLHAKQAAEQRLGQVLLRVENATMRKFNPEDISLHSEDSGIGGENESLAGFERHRRHRGSAGSASCESRCSIRHALETAANNFPNQAGLNEDDEEEDEDEEEEDDEDDDEEDGEEEGARFGRKRSNSSPPDPSRPQALHVNSECMEGHQVRRPVTAAPSARPGVLLTTRHASALLERQKSQKGLDQEMRHVDERWGDKETSRAHYSVYQDGLRRSLSICGGASSLPPLEPHPPGHNSVRKLINTFSHGVDGRPDQSLANLPPHIRRPRRSGTLLLPDIGNGDRPSITNGNNNNNSWPDGRNDLDVDSLPPPPLEVLMDNSFSTVENSEDELEPHEYLDRGRPVINKRTGVSQRLRASVQNVTLLPNRASVRQSSMGVTPVPPVRQDAVVGSHLLHHFEQQLETKFDPESEKASALYQQARKIIHLCNAAETTVWKNQADQYRASSPLQAELGSRQGEAETPPCSVPVMAPPVSRVRLPPSCPTSVHQRYPCPPAFRAQPTSGGPPSRPASRSSSRSSSPRATTWARQNSAEEIIPSVSFGDARSVFCQNGTQSSQGQTSQARPPIRGTSARRIQSERRSMTLHPEGSQNDGTSLTHAKEKDPVNL